MIYLKNKKLMLGQGKLFLLALFLLIVFYFGVFVYLNEKIGKIETRLGNLEEAVRQSPRVIIEEGGLPREGIEIPLPELPGEE